MTIAVTVSAGTEAEKIVHNVSIANDVSAGGKHHESSQTFRVATSISLHCQEPNEKLIWLCCSARLSAKIHQINYNLQSLLGSVIVDGSRWLAHLLKVFLVVTGRLVDYQPILSPSITADLSLSPKGTSAVTFMKSVSKPKRLMYRWSEGAMNHTYLLVCGKEEDLVCWCIPVSLHFTIYWWWVLVTES